MNQRKTSGKGVIGNFLSGLATNEIPKLTPLAQAGGAALIGGRIPGIGGQIISGAAAPIIGSLVNTGAGVLGGLLSALPFQKGGIVGAGSMGFTTPLKLNPFTGKMEPDYGSSLSGLMYRKGGVVMPMYMKPKRGKKAKVPKKPKRKTMEK